MNKIGLVTQVAKEINVIIEMVLIVRILLTPCTCTKWPITKKDVREPIIPRVNKDPNSALPNPRFFFTSAKRVTQLIIPKPNKKWTEAKSLRSVLVNLLF